MWCGSRDDNDPYVLLRFSSTVVITGLVSGGYTSTVGSDMRYVTNFTIEYSLSSYADDFTFYSTNVTGSPKVYVGYCSLAFRLFSGIFVTYCTLSKARVEPGNKADKY